MQINNNFLLLLVNGIKLIRHFISIENIHSNTKGKYNAINLKNNSIRIKKKQEKNSSL